MSLLINTFLRGPILKSLRLHIPCRTIQLTQVQQLYGSAALGIDGYLHARNDIKKRIASVAEKLRAKVTEFVDDPKSMVFTEDLKNMIHIAEPTDLEIIHKMIKKFNTQKAERRFGSFVFGSVVMRMFHFLDAPKEALKCFEDPDNGNFFDQHVTYQLLLDLLYRHQMYDDMYRVFEIVKDRQVNMTKYPKYPVVLILAACYKQNTPQSMEYASKLWSDMNKTGTTPLRRACGFFGALALKQGAPHLALESTLVSQKQHYVTIRNIKAMALADMGRVDGALTELRKVLEIDSPQQKDKHTFFEETILRVKAAAEKCDSQTLKKLFEEVYKELSDRQLIDSKLTLDTLLNSEINKVEKKPDAPRSGMPDANKTRRPFGMQRRQQNDDYEIYEL